MATTPPAEWPTSDTDARSSASRRPARSATRSERVQGAGSGEESPCDLMSKRTVRKRWLRSPACSAHTEPEAARPWTKTTAGASAGPSISQEICLPLAVTSICSDCLQPGAANTLRAHPRAFGGPAQNTRKAFRLGMKVVCVSPPPRSTSSGTFRVMPLLSPRRNLTPPPR